ncbi:MAG: ABC transporter ATP-binding protein [Myxococcales bacterium]|nr:ABC transporter ATP-binding protein [Myxococcales bacterium]
MPPLPTLPPLQTQPASPPMLEVRDLHAAYGAILAVNGVTLDVRSGEIVTLIGANGAGKTTTLNCIAGLLKPKSGSVRFDGEDLARVPAHDIVRRGLVMAPEGRRVFPRMTVAENLEMGAFTRKDKDGIRADFERVYGLFPILLERAQQVAGTLSGGEQQMLAVGRAMMARPRLLLLDEPSLGLAPLIVKRIFEVIRTLNEAGTTILLVEQNARMALKTAHRGYVLETGQVTMVDDAARLLADARVQAAYLGE